MRIGEEGRGDRGIRKKNFCWSGVVLVIKVGGVGCRLTIEFKIEVIFVKEC